LAPTMPARSRWVRCSEILVPPSGSGWPGSAARPSTSLASRRLTSSDTRASIRASRPASRAATWRSRAEEAGGLASRKPQKGSRPMAQAGVGEVARAPAVRRAAFRRAGSAARAVKAERRADKVAGPDDGVHELAAAADGGDNRDLTGGQHHHVVGRFALAHQEAAHRVVERGGLGDQGGQGVGLPMAEDGALAEDLEQDRLVGRRSPSGHGPTPCPDSPGGPPGGPPDPSWRRRTSRWAPMVVAWSSARLAAAPASSS